MTGRCCSATRVACCSSRRRPARAWARRGWPRRCGSLPSALGRFAALHPGVKLEVQIGVSADLIEQLNAGRLDVVFAKRPLGTSKGRLAWREPLVWAAADTFDVLPGAALPLALSLGC